jgi:predicted amidohydrolase YtcJ
MFADIILLNGKIVTVDEKESVVEALAVKFGKIVAVGSNEETKKSIGDGTEVIDLKGRTVIPGLIDSHCHMVSTGIEMMMGSIDLSEEAGIKSVVDIKARIADKAKETPKSEWIIGVKYDDSKLVEKRHPTRWELDEAAPDNPVIISTVGGHFSVANTRAFEKANVTKDTPDPVGGMFERDSQSGELTGGVHEKAREIIIPDIFYCKDLSRELAANAAKQMLLENAASGLTCIYDVVGQPEIRAILDLKNRDELLIRVRMDIFIDLFPQLNKLGINRGFGGEWLKICGLKFFFDGAISARTAAVSEPYLHRPDFYGVMSTTEKIAQKSISEAYKAGYRISAHANGDRAISMYLDIMEKTQKEFPRCDSRNRIIHCTVVNPKLVARIKKLDFLPTIFGAYPYYHGDKLIPAFGEKRLEWMFAARSFLKAGVKVAAHSDHSASPFPPLMGIHSLVNRMTKSGKTIGQSQKISVMDAIKLYTINAAYHSFDEDILGSLEVGKCADMVVLGKDLLTVPPETIIDIPIDMTIVGGKIVYERQD